MARPKIDVNRAQNIICAAEELFARYGFERTSIEDIARHLGIGKGSIYLEFRTKEEILFRILSGYARSLQESFEAKVHDHSTSPLATLRQVYIEETISCYDRVTRDIHSPETLLHTSISMKRHFADFFMTKRKFLHMLLMRAAEVGEIRKEKATDEMALALMMATSALFPPYVDNFSESTTIKNRQDLIDQVPIVIDLIIDGLRA